MKRTITIALLTLTSACGLAHDLDPTVGPPLQDQEFEDSRSAYPYHIVGGAYLYEIHMAGTRYCYVLASTDPNQNKVFCTTGR